MRERDEVLAAIRNRLERAAATRDVRPLLEPDVPAQARWLAELSAANKDDLEAAHLGGWLHWVRYHGTADAGDLIAAINAFTGCFIAGLDDIPGELWPALARRALPAAQGRLGNLLQSRADRDGADATVLLWQRIVAAIPAADPDRPAQLSNLGVALLGWFAHTRNPAHLDAAIGQCRAAVTAAPAGLPDQALLLSNFSHALQVRAGVTGSAPDLDEAIKVGRAAVAITAAHDPERAARLADLGTSLRARFERAGRLSDLDAAIDACAGRASGRASYAAGPGHDPLLAGGRITRALHAHREPGRCQRSDRRRPGGRAVGAVQPGRPGGESVHPRQCAHGSL